MKTIGEQLEAWAVSRIETEFPNDVSLLVRHKSLCLDNDHDKIGFCYYVPATARAGGLSRTFVIDGVGYDLFPFSWEQLEQMSEVNHYNLTCLDIDDASIVWARNDEDRRRFGSLQAKLRANLQNPSLMRQRARKWVDAAADIYGKTLFEERAYIIRKNAGYICDLLALAVAYENGMFYRRGQTGQLAELAKMPRVPEGFTALYETVVREKDTDRQKRLCHDMLVMTSGFLEGASAGKKKRGAAELAGWYHELSYTWRRVYHFCEAGDDISAYVWCCMLQEELRGLAEDYELGDIDILGAFDAKNLTAFQARAEEVERGIVSAIERDGGKLDVYQSIEEFLEQNA
ncbi:MAG: hypothetical protein LBU58_06195 [Clostridiales bacterium]|jgi:hypothetical protein|nr:hypothetical protein [Clostridiales bacterium]